MFILLFVFFLDRYCGGCVFARRVLNILKPTTYNDEVSVDDITVQNIKISTLYKSLVVILIHFL
jgi:hypothetical protein